MGRPLIEALDAGKGEAEALDASSQGEALHGAECPCPECYPNEALSLADRRLLWELIGERKANPTRRSE